MESVEKKQRQHPILSNRELDVIRLVALGKSDIEAGIILGISPRTVRYHYDNLKRKANFGLQSRAAVIAHFASEKVDEPIVIPEEPASPILKLRPREIEILELLRGGKLDGQIANLLGIGTRTVRFHVDNAKFRNKISTRNLLLLRFIKQQTKK